MTSPVLLMCIDGLDWDLLNSFLDEGLLPNFREFIEGGISGEIQSIKPAISARIWASVYSGKSPDKHGIRDFYDNRVQVKQIWDILHESGERIGVFNPLTLFEAKPVNGFLVPGHMARVASVYPTDLKFLKDFSIDVRSNRMSLSKMMKYAYKLKRKGCRLTTLFKAASLYLGLSLFSNKALLDSFYRKKEIETLINTDVFLYCLQEYSPSFVVFYDNGVDTVSHRYWKYMNPQSDGYSKYGNVIKNYYVLMDKILGKLTSTLNEDWTVIVVSDHGFKASRSYTRFGVSIDTLLQLLDLEENV